MVTVDKVKGVGPKSLMLLNKIGINTVSDLVEHYPFRYDVLTRTDLSKTDDNDKVIIDGKVESVPILLRFKQGLNKLNFRLVTNKEVVGVSIFNRAFMKNSLTIGSNVIVIGKYDKTKNIITASDIKFGTLGTTSKIEAVYHVTNGLSSKVLANYINSALLFNSKDIIDYIPGYLRTKYEFSNKKTALNIVQNPPNMEKLKQSAIRLKYEELFEFMFKINYLKKEHKKERIGIIRNISDKDVKDFIKKLPFKLTTDQLKAIDEIVKDLNSKSRMNRLLQGDVGSGKTIVSIIAMYLNKLSGYQSALMAPTEILAVQHYNNIKEILKDYDINVELLTGSQLKKEKIDIYKRLLDGSIDIIIGTHALIQEDVKYKNLGLVITDEQHRFGVNQRGLLNEKGEKPDVLYMSATPIPRTYALTIYGDMDITSIKEMPKGRVPIKTYVKNNDDIKEVLEMMYEEL